jgi:hypothetical protein
LRWRRGYLPVLLTGLTSPDGDIEGLAGCLAFDALRQFGSLVFPDRFHMEAKWVLCQSSEAFLLGLIAE